MSNLKEGDKFGQSFLRVWGELVFNLSTVIICCKEILKQQTMAQDASDVYSMTGWGAMGGNNHVSREEPSFSIVGKDW